MTGEKRASQPDELMVVNHTPGQECRIAILEDGHLEELYSERADTVSSVGNIYKGRVVNVQAAIQAAFIEFGASQNGFLHITDLHPRYFREKGGSERIGKKTARRSRPPIQDCLKRGQEVLVRVLKEGIGSKGPTLSSYLSIPGRLLVLMPYAEGIGVSRDIEDDESRRQMRTALADINLPDDFGFILRTAGVNQTKTDLKRDAAYLMRLWKVMSKRIDSVGAPCELYTESDLLTRTLRDVLRPSIKAIVVDSEAGWENATSFLRVIAPRSTVTVLRSKSTVPIFHDFDIERQIELIHGREVPLPSGGRLVFDQTEALVAIDVNSGRSRRARDSETNAFQTNLEAADEICRQLRLRDLGGLVLSDLIDMISMKHRREVEDRFRANLKRDRARSTILKISDFGILEMTRQRMRPSLQESHYNDCEHCEGQGRIRAPEHVAADAVRHVASLAGHDRVRRVEVTCSPAVASVLLSTRRREFNEMEDTTGTTVDVRVSETIAADEVAYHAYDNDFSDIELRSLPTLKPRTLAQLLRGVPKATAPPEEPAETEELEASEAAKSSGKKTRRRRSRRRRGTPAPADATAIALAGDFTEELEAMEESAEPTPKKTRRRRGSRGGRGRRKRGRSGDSEASETSETSKTTETAGTGLRVYLLARELGVTSKDILDRCRAEGAPSLKNHMSTVTPEDLDMIRAWFRDSAPPEKTAKESAPRKKRRRGRRGGRGRRRRKSSPGADGKVDPDKTPDPVAEEKAEAPVPEEPPRKKRRRTLYGSRRTVTPSEAHEATQEA